MSTSPTLRRSLSLRDLIVYGLVFVGPLAPVGIFGVLDARSHGAVALVYVVASVAMAFTAWSYAEMSREIPRAGSVFAYAGAGLGPRAGFVAGWLVMLDYVLIPSVAYLFSGIALHALLPAVPAWVFTLAAFIVTTVINQTGARVAARVGSVVLVAELLVLLCLVVASIVFLMQSGPTRPWLAPLVGEASFSMSAVTGAASVAILSFLGFDAIASFAEESAGDRRQIGVAVTTCLVVAGLLFIVQSWLGALISPLSWSTLLAQPERQGSAFYGAVRSSIGPWMQVTLAVTKAVGPAFAAMSAQAAAARLLFGMARDGGLPSVLARVDATHGVPRTALTTVAALTVAVSVWAARRPDGLDVLVSVVDMGALSAFALLHLSVVGYFCVQRKAPSRVAHWVVPSLGLLVTLGVIAEASAVAKVTAVTWLLVGLLVMAAGSTQVRTATTAR